MGLAIGAGFYFAAVIACILILATIIIFTKLGKLIMSLSRNINLYVEYENDDTALEIISKLKESDVRIFDVEIEKARNSNSGYPNAIFSLILPKKASHTIVFTAVSTVEGIRSVKEL
jgi:putative Mg2+ transporter-C (MgtC) family protein